MREFIDPRVALEELQTANTAEWEAKQAAHEAHLTAMRALDLPPRHWRCYTIGDTVELTLPERDDTMLVSGLVGRIVLGTAQPFTPGRRTGHAAYLTPLNPNPGNLRVPLVKPKHEPSAAVALVPTDFDPDSRLTVVDVQEAMELVAQEGLVLTKRELHEAWLKALRSKHSLRARTAKSTRHTA